ncbi:MAG: response regulator [Chitinophagaceae bacterium]
MKTPFRFIIIDDSPVVHMLCNFIIRKIVRDAGIINFEIPENGLDYIIQKYANNELPTILFLDINMPTMSGWEFLEKFDNLTEKIKNQFWIYIMSSSIDSGDMQSARENENVADYMEKPLSEKMILSILEKQEERV